MKINKWVYSFIWDLRVTIFLLWLQRVMRWIWDWAKYHNSHSSKSIRVTKLFFCQNDVLLGRSFWPKDNLVTLILFELQLLWYLAQSQIHRITLYFILYDNHRTYWAFSVIVCLKIKHSASNFSCKAISSDPSPILSRTSAMISVWVLKKINENTCILLTSSNNLISEFRIPNTYNEIFVLIFLMILRTHFEASLRFWNN